MSFRFIDQSNIDGSDRKAIRSHVMKGKNAGRSIKRASRLHTTKNYGPQEQASCNNATFQNSVGITGENSIKRHFGHQFTGYALSMDLSADHRKTIHQFFVIIDEAGYTFKFCNPCLSKDSLWDKYMTWTWDKAHLLSTLCLMEACNDFYLGRPTLSPPVLKHLSTAFRLVNQRLSSDEALTEVTLLMVLALIIIEQLYDDPQRWQVHLKGFFRIVELRGGLARHQDRWEIAHKICRADIDFALSTGSSPQIKIDSISFILLESIHSLHNTDSARHKLPKSLDTLSPALHDVARDAILFAKKINVSDYHKMPQREFHANLISISFRLLDISSLNAAFFNNTLDLCCYLGLTAFMVTTMFQFGRRRLFRQQLLTDKMRALLLDLDRQTTLDSSLALWLLFIGRLSVFEEGDEAWLLPRMATEINKLCIADLPSLYEQLTQYPWIDLLYNKTVENIWNCILANKRNDTQGVAVEANWTPVQFHPPI